MNTTTTTDSNGPVVRQSLAEQIDRLDSILDGLADNLAQAVAEAVQEAVGAAVESALQEALRNPELLRALQAQAAPRRPAAPRTARTDALVAGLRQKATELSDWLGRAWDGLGVGVQHAHTALQEKWQQASAWCLTLCNTLPALLLLLWQLRRPLLIALAVGLILAVGCYFAGPLVASLVCGLAGFLASLVVTALNSWRRLLLTLPAATPTVRPRRPDDHPSSSTSDDETTTTLQA